MVFSSSSPFLTVGSRVSLRGTVALHRDADGLSRLEIKVNRAERQKMNVPKTSNHEDKRSWTGRKSE